ncbi:MAG: DnaJ C-terminal domain-containing protein [Azonexus sp.]|nr:DnaJ C-terminal domain-containing protein [Azonexus sp.]
MDSYVILGLPQGAAPADIKRAYRRLAMRWHPDRNTHPEATERFKAIRGAYDALMLAEPVEAPDDGETEVEPEAEESVAKAADIRLNLEVSLQEAATGCRKTVAYTRGKACPTCEGSGEYGISRTRFCPACHGSGRVHDAKRVLVPCTDCGGRGFFSERICPDCAGSGRETASVSLEVTVPPGMLPGGELRVVGQGEPETEDLQAGDLYLTVVIRTHPLFQLRGRNLHFSMPVSALAMLAGGDIELPLLSGVLTHRLEAGKPKTQELRLAGKGYPGRGKIPAGDLVVELQPSFPRNLKAAQRKLLLQADASLMGNVAESFPEIDAWQQANALD